MKNRFEIPILLMAMALALVPGMKAQDQDNATPGVARVSVINGNVSTQRGDAGEWVAATVNTPLEAGDSISTAQDSRTEVQLDYADILRLAGSTDAKIADLDNSHIQVQVAQGLVDFTVLKGANTQVEIDTPNVAIHPAEPGVYRIEVDSQSETRITVRRGKAEVSTQQGSAELDPGRLMMVEGSENPQYQITEASGKDDWDHWNDQRNSLIENAQSWHHDNPYYTGTADLDAYGHWEYVPGYDWCWTPYINAGWVPYSAGNWVWEPYYGWTWASYEPWGWAPYHYGRWFLYGSSWAWWPGPVTPFYRPIWAPAYVSFFGFGGGGFGFGVGVGFGFGFGRVGWLPVGPCDPFLPWYGRGRFGYRAVNITNITNITNIRNYNGMPYVRPLAGAGRPVYSNYRAALSNPRVRNAIMSVPSNRFGTAGAARAHMGGMSQAEFRQASFVSGRLPIVPTRASLSATDRPVNRASLPSAAVTNRRFYMNRQPAARTEPFSQQTARLQEMVRNNNANGRFDSAQNGRSQIGTPGRATTFGNGQNRSTLFGNRSSAQFGSSRTTTAFGNQPAQNNGWRRFGTSANGGSTAGRQSFSTGQPANRTPFYDNNSRVFNSSQQAARPGWRNFSNSPNNSTYRSGFNNSRTPASNFPQRSTTPGSNGGRSGSQQFNSRPAPSSRNYAYPSYQGRGGGHNFTQSGGSWRDFSGGGQKPPLQLNHPIVTGRSSGYGNYQGSWGHGYYSAPARSSPSYSRGGGFSSGGGGGSYSHGGGGGGYSHGGGGGGGGGSHGGGGGGYHGGGGGGGYSHGGGGGGSHGGGRR